MHSCPQIRGHRCMHAHMHAHTHTRTLAHTHAHTGMHPHVHACALRCVHLRTDARMQALPGTELAKNSCCRGIQTRGQVKRMQTYMHLMHSQLTTSAYMHALARAHTYAHARAQAHAHTYVHTCTHTRSSDAQSMILDSSSVQGKRLIWWQPGCTTRSTCMQRQQAQ